MTQTPESQETQTLSPLLKLVDHGWEFARSYIADNNQELTPQFIAENDKGEIEVYVVPWQGDAEKDAALEFLRRQFAERNIKRYVLLSEAWMVKLPHGPFPPPNIRPSEQPDRQQVLMVTGVDPEAGEILSYTAEIIDGPPREVLPKQAMPMSMAGRMTELLGPVREPSIN